MLEVYSLDAVASENANFPLNNVALEKGGTAQLSGNSTIQLNKCGVYMVSCDASAAAASTIQLKKNGVLQPQAQATGTSLSFVTLVQVPSNNTNCCCSSPTILQVSNPTTASETLTNLNVCITKIC